MNEWREEGKKLEAESSHIQTVTTASQQGKARRNNRQK